MSYTYEDEINFIKGIYCAARLISDETGYSWELLLSQVASETGWGKSILPGTNNLFNIKADPSWHGPKGNFNVWEEDKSGKKHWQWDWFRIYDSYADSFRDRIKFVQENKRYTDAGLNSPGVKGDLVKEANALQKAGYASDIDYADKLVEVARCRSMKRAIAAAQKVGCGPALPVIELLFFDGAKVALRNAKINVTLNDKSQDTTTNDQGSFHIRIAPKTEGVIKLKIFDEDHRKWIDLDPVPLPSPMESKLVTVRAPIFKAYSATSQHVKDDSKAKAKADNSAAEEKADAAHFEKYTVKKGDTLYLIGKKYKVRYLTLAEINAIQSPFILRIGQILKVPKPAGSSQSTAPHESQPEASTPRTSTSSSGTSNGSQVPIESHGIAPTMTAAPKLDAPHAPEKTLSEVISTDNSVHTNYHRNESSDPQTDLMLASRAPWMKYAQEEFKKGVKRHTDKTSDPNIVGYFGYTSLAKTADGKTDKTPYCAAFVNYCLAQECLRGTNNAMATSFLNWGKSTKGNKPAFGAVAVVQFPTKKGQKPQHHVTFVTGINPGGLLATLGGNQGHAHEVSHSALPLNWVVAYRYPADYHDNDEDYVLHPVKCDSSTMSGKSTH